jgi:xanthine dehydrogenase molybdopterin-binding subunit B
MWRLADALVGADAIRSPHHSATFTLGRFRRPAYKKWPGLERVFTAADVPGNNGYGIYPDVKDQPAFADGKCVSRVKRLSHWWATMPAVYGIRDEEVYQFIYEAARPAFRISRAR